MNIEGTIISVAAEKKTASASFKDFLLKTNENFPQTLKFTLKYNKYTEEIFDTIENYIGSHAKVEFNITGNEWNGKHYVQLNAWKLEVQRRNRQEEPVGYKIETAAPFNDDLPF